MCICESAWKRRRLTRDTDAHNAGDQTESESASELDYTTELANEPEHANEPDHLNEPDPTNGIEQGLELFRSLGFIHIASLWELHFGNNIDAVFAAREHGD